MTAQPVAIGRAGERKVWFDPERRSRHLHVIGGSGMGKTKFLEHLIREDILKGHGLCLIDPHGEVYENILRWCAAIRADRFCRIHLIDPSLPGWRTGFNPLKRYPHEQPLHRVDNVIEALAQVWGGEDSLSTPSIRTVLRAIFSVLVPRAYTLNEAFSLTSLHDEEHLRQFLTSRVAHPILREVWEGYRTIADKAPREFVAEFGGARRRLFELLHDSDLCEMFGQVAHAIDFRRCMDEGDVVLVNLSANAVDEGRGRAIGALLVRELFLVAKRRDVSHAKKHPFYLYIDECAQYLTADIGKLLAQTRKFGLHAILAHQWLEQLREASPAIYAAVMAIQNKVVFGGLDDPDAALISDELFRTEYDIEMPIELLIKPTVVRYVQTWLHHWSESEGESYSESDAVTQSGGVSEGISQLYDQFGYPMGTVTMSGGSHLAVGTTSGRGWTHSRSRTEGAAESFVPELEDRPSAVHGLDNVRHLAISRLRSLPERQAVVKAPGLPSFDIRTFTVPPTGIHDDSVLSFVERVMAASPYAVRAEEARHEIELRAHEIRRDIAAWNEPVIEEEVTDQYLSG